MKRVLTGVLCVLILFLLFLPVCATENEIIDSVFDTASSDVQSYLDDLGIHNGSLQELSGVDLNDLLLLIKEMIIDKASRPFRVFVICVVIILILTFSQSFAHGNDEMKRITDCIGIVMIIFTLLSPISELIRAVLGTGNSLSVMIKTQIPVLAALLTISGNPAAAACIQGFSFGILQLFTQLITEISAPFSAVFICLVTSNSIQNMPFAEKTAAFFKKSVSFILTLLSGLFSAFLSLKSVLAVSADRVGIRGMKFIVGNMIPVVGSALSEAMSSVVSSVALLKHTGCILSVVILFFTVAPMLTELMIWSFMMKALSLVSSVFAQDVCSSYFSSLDGLFVLQSVILIYQFFLSILGIILIMMMNGR